MSSLLVTTSRKPGQLTRRVARTLALLLGAHYENRGKASVAEVGARAEQLGLLRLMFVYEAHGNPARLAFWQGGWLEQEFRITGVREASAKGRRLPGQAIIVQADAASTKLRELLGLPQTVEAGRFVTVTINSSEIRFELDRAPVLVLIGRFTTSEPARSPA